MVSAGGFSPEGRSFEACGAAAAWVAVGGMAFAGANSALLYRGATGGWSTVVRDPELRTYAAIAALASIAAALLLQSTYGAADAWRHDTFQALSILTSTGYASADFALWPERSQAILLVVALIGGSAGSAAGGVKVAIGLLTFCMYAGRLEEVTVFAIFAPGWWRVPRPGRGFER